MESAPQESKQNERSPYAHMSDEELREEFRRAERLYHQPEAGGSDRKDYFALEKEMKERGLN